VINIGRIKFVLTKCMLLIEINFLVLFYLYLSLYLKRVLFIKFARNFLKIFLATNEKV